MEKLYHLFKPMPFEWLKPDVPLNHWKIDPKASRVTIKVDPPRFFTKEALDFLNSLDIHADPESILLLGIPAGMAVNIHTDWTACIDPTVGHYRGYWSLNIPIGVEDVYTVWYDGPVKLNHVYTEEEAGNVLFEDIIKVPNIVRTDIPHRVDNRGTNTTWRVCLRCRGPIKSWPDAVKLLEPYLES